MITEEYIKLQKHIIFWLRFLQQGRPRALRAVVVACRRAYLMSPLRWVTYVRSLGCMIHYEPWHADVQFAALISEQIGKQRDGKIFIRNLLGKKLRNDNAGNVVDIKQGEGRSGSNCLRTPYCAQPKALEIGDVLGIGGQVVDLPREGANGQILVRLSEGNAVAWIAFPPESRLVLRNGVRVSASSVRQ